MPWKPIAASPNWYDSLGLLVMLVLMAPVAEEVFFRGMLYNVAAAATPRRRRRSLAGDYLWPESLWS